MLFNAEKIKIWIYFLIYKNLYQNRIKCRKPASEKNTKNSNSTPRVKKNLIKFKTSCALVFY